MRATKYAASLPQVTDRVRPARYGGVADVDIGVIYTHEQALMPPLISSLCRSGEGIDMRLILVDNASREGVEAWTAQLPHTLVLRNQQRLGYAHNLNQIIEHATAPYVLLMNTDMYFDPTAQCVARMVEFMDRHPDCGIAGCRLYHANGDYAHSARRFQTWRTIAARRGGMPRLFRSELDRYLYRDRDCHDSFDCDWLSGCFMFARRAALADVGSFDAKYPKYFEDVDICLRLALVGWRVMFNGQTFAYHCEQRASKAILSRDGWHHAWSYLRWLRKWGLNPGRLLRSPPPKLLPLEPAAETPLRRAA